MHLEDLYRLLREHVQAQGIVDWLDELSSWLTKPDVCSREIDIPYTHMGS